MYLETLGLIMVAISMAIALPLINPIKGYTKHITFIYMWIWYTFYFLLVPFYFILVGDYALYSISFNGFLAPTLFLYAFGLNTFLIGYYVYQNYIIKLSNPLPTISIYEGVIAKYILPLSLLFLVILNWQFGGIKWWLMGDYSINSTNTRIAAEAGYSKYLSSLLDSIIVATAILLLSKAKIAWKIAYTIPILYIYLISGERYRLILLASIIIIYLIQTHYFTKKRVLISLPIVLVLLGCFWWYSSNRAIINKRFDTPIEWTNDRQGLSAFAGELSNCKTLALLLKTQKEGQFEYDYGETFSKSALIRAIPKFIYPEKVDYTPPQVATIYKLFTLRKEKKQGVALTNLGSYYHAFGVLGVGLGMLLYGLWIGFVASKLQHNEFLTALFTALQFQVITRGYFPQIVELTFYCALPLVVIVISKKLIKSE